MAIQIIDNFSLNTNKPIDNRFVVGGGNFYSDKDDITHKYVGLRVWDLTIGANGTPFVWNGTQWISENTLGISGSGTININYVSKFDSSNTITNSQIFDNGTNVGIGTITPTNKLSVNGDVSANNFIGNGSQLTSLNINGSNVTGKIGLNNLPNGTNGQILQSTGTSTQWVNQNTLSVGSATNATNVNIISDATSNNNRYIPFVHGTGNQQIRINTTNSIRINPFNGNIGIGGNAQSYRLYVNGGASIGTTTAPPSNGLRVQGTSDFRKIIINGSGVGQLSPLRINLNTNNWIEEGLFTNYQWKRGRCASLTPSLNGAWGFGFEEFGGAPSLVWKIFKGTAANDPVIFSGSNINMRLTEWEGLNIDKFADSNTILVLKESGSDRFQFANSGQAFKSGSGNTWNNVSDLRIKEDIRPFSDGLSKILSLNPVYFKYIDKNINSVENIGFIAQDLEDITPYMVSTRKMFELEDCRILDESALTKILVNAIKEQQSIIEDLTKRIEDLES
jgi:hypothetical protein